MNGFKCEVYLCEITIKLNADNTTIIVSELFTDPNKALRMWEFFKDNKDDIDWMTWKDNSGRNRYFPNKQL